MTESAEQKAIVHWWGLQYPEYEKNLFHIPNGAKRTKFQGAELKRLGLRPGVPDLFLAVPRGTFHGMFIELKTSKGVVSPVQLSYLELLTEEGYCAVVSRGAEDAIGKLQDYMKS
jgi:hypothetical protein